MHSKNLSQLRELNISNWKNLTNTGIQVRWTAWERCVKCDRSGRVKWVGSSQMRLGLLISISLPNWLSVVENRISEVLLTESHNRYSDYRLTALNETRSSWVRSSQLGEVKWDKVGRGDVQSCCVKLSETGSGICWVRSSGVRCNLAPVTDAFCVIINRAMEVIGFSPKPIKGGGWLLSSLLWRSVVKKMQLKFK